MNLLCPACHTPLPDVAAVAAAADPVVTCPVCAAEVDISRAGTQAGRPRFVPELDRTGTVIGGFRVDGLIGGGGMGTVYRASAPDGARVALKVLSHALGDAPAFVARFAREVEALARLDHPAIVRVLANGTEAATGVPWFAMELVDGPDLKTRLAEGSLAPDEVGRIFGRLFDALDHAHARGVVHRDLKPANVLLSAAGAKLADFGIARFEPGALTRSQAVTRLTETAVVIGSLPYMSPEQKRGAPVDGRSDLFSAGVMLYEAATGAIPQGAFSPPSQLDARFGRAFDELVMRLLHPDPARRPAAAAEVRRALAAATSGRRARAFVTRATAAVALSLVVLIATFGGWTALRKGRATRGAASKADVRGATQNVAEAIRPVAVQGAIPVAKAGPGGDPAPEPLPTEAPSDEAVTGTAAASLEAKKSGAFSDRANAPPPNLQAMLGQSLDRDLGAADKRAPGGKKRLEPKYRVDVKLAPIAKSSSTSKSKMKSRPSKLPPATVDAELPPADASNSGDPTSAKARSKSEALDRPTKGPFRPERK